MTGGSGIGTGEMPSGGGNELIKVSPTGQTRWWGKFDELGCRMLDWSSFRATTVQKTDLGLKDLPLGGYIVRGNTSACKSVALYVAP